MTMRRIGLVLLAALACAVLACDDDDPVTPEPPWSPAEPTLPENVLENLVTIYNDDEHTAAERLVAYEALLLHPSIDPPRSGFVFNLMSDFPLPPGWGLDTELEVHRALFAAQADSTIHSIELRLTYGATEAIVDNPGRAGWERIFVSSVYLLLLFSPDDGLEVNGHQANFEFAPDTTQPPAEGGRFYGRYWIGEWTELARPAPRGETAVEPATWGGIKSLFLPGARGLRTGASP